MARIAGRKAIGRGINRRGACFAGRARLPRTNGPAVDERDPRVRRRGASRKEDDRHKGSRCPTTKAVTAHRRILAAHDDGSGKRTALQWAIPRNEARVRACHDGAVDHALDPRLSDISLAVVDDHPAIALAIVATTAAEPAEPGRRPIRIVGTARSVADALMLIESPDAIPDVLLCDIQLEAGVDGLQVVAAAHEAGVRAIVLTSFDRSSLMREAFERGASGFLHKTAEVPDILAAVRTVADGGTAFSAATLDAARYAPRPPSAREIEVIAQIQRGATSDEIGARLGISARTVESHVRRLFDRYGVVSRAELAVLAVNEGWIEAARG